MKKQCTKLKTVVCMLLFAALLAGCSANTTQATTEAPTTALAEDNTSEAEESSSVAHTPVEYKVETYAQLMEAVEKAEEGDLILFAQDIKTTDGTYELAAAVDVVTGATMKINKSITVDGGGYTLDGDGYPTFEISNEAGYGAEVVVKNMTIENAAYTPKLGGAMIVESGAVLNMEDVTIRNCSGKNMWDCNGGGAVYVYNHGGATPALNAVNCTFENNYVGEGLTGNGGAIYGTNGNVTLTNCTFTGNKAANGGSVAMDGIGTLSITDCTFSEGLALVAGKDIYIFNGKSIGKADTIIKSIITVENISGTFSSAASDDGSDTALTDMDVVLGRYEEKVEFEGVKIHDVTFDGIERTK